MNHDELLRTQQERDLYSRILSLSVCDDLSPLLREALQLIVDITQSQRGYLALYEPKEKEPRYWLAKGFSEDEVQNIRKKISRGVISAALTTGQTILLDSALEDPRFQGNTSVQALEIEAVLCAPIGAKNPVGVLYLQGKPHARFTEEDKHRAEIFSRHLAPLVDRLLLKQYQQDATDPTLSYRQRLKLDALSGRSKAMAEVFAQLEKAARFELTVLLRGASGTGKTVIARAIHQNSTRHEKPFLELNCAALPESLFESEFFGALQGAHSTANRKILGKVAAAEGGTLFLDEIGELPLTVQSKLLQLLQSKEYFPLGATKPEKADIRLITATNINIEESVRQKKFREDLFYRLKVLSLYVPPLSDRSEDIPDLLRSFCQKVCEQHKLPSITPTHEALRAAEMCEWPGNIRQLSHAAEVATINAAMEGKAEVSLHHLFAEVSKQDASLSYQEAMRRSQHQIISKALSDADWNISEAARRLSLNRSYLHQMIQSLNLKR
jgi:Nif-specific regulatory protein